MDITMITKLLDAGFTAEEIRGMGVLSVRADPAPAAVPEDPAPQAEPEKEPEPAAPEDKQKQEPKMDAILQKIDNLTGSITALLNRSAGSRTQDQKDDTVDDILAKAFFMKEE